jgi:hypothetical protein
MLSLLIVLEKNQPLIYLVLLLLGLVFPFRWLRRAWKEWREAYFSLEREIAMRRLAQAVFAAVLVLILLFAEFVIANFIVPGLPASALIGTPTVDLLSGTPVGEAAQASLLGGASVAAAPAAGADGCVPGKLEITSPKAGENISGSVDIVGTVQVPGFAFYKYEYSQPGAAVWATISANREAKNNESIGAWNTSALIPGDYLLQLVVTDGQGQTLPACIISVRVTGQ